MMKYEYRELMERIHVPEELNDRVVQAARQQSEEKTATKRRNLHSVFRAAACAALALVLVLGSVRWRPAEEAGDSTEQTGAMTLSYTFGLTAYAAEGESVAASPNGGIVFQWTENAGHFRVTGEGIETLALSTDRGELWREGSCFGNGVTEAFDPAAVYGIAPAKGETMESLDGAKLTMTAVFADGTEKAETYNLSAESLRTFENEDGSQVLVPALSGDEAAEVPALYAVSESDSVWFQWPVEGANTVSLSNAYGYRVIPGGESRAFHAGIDIPAQQGSPVTAAAAGTVVTAEFDRDKGNYIVIDHGSGMETAYAHCLSLAVEVGDTVETGQKIAEVGSTGKSTGPHLHFEVQQDGEAQNPVAYFDSAIRDTLRMG